MQTRFGVARCCCDTTQPGLCVVYNKSNFTELPDGWSGNLFKISFSGGNMILTEPVGILDDLQPTQSLMEYVFEVDESTCYVHFGDQHLFRLDFGSQEILSAGVRRPFTLNAGQEYTVLVNAGAFGKSWFLDGDLVGFDEASPARNTGSVGIVGGAPESKLTLKSMKRTTAGVWSGLNQIDCPCAYAEDSWDDDFSAAIINERYVIPYKGTYGGGILDGGSGFGAAAGLTLRGHFSSPTLTPTNYSLEVEYGKNTAFFQNQSASLVGVFDRSVSAMTVQIAYEGGTFASGNNGGILVAANDHQDSKVTLFERIPGFGVADGQTITLKIELIKVYDTWTINYLVDGINIWSEVVTSAADLITNARACYGYSEIAASGGFWADNWVVTSA